MMWLDVLEKKEINGSHKKEYYYEFLKETNVSMVIFLGLGLRGNSCCPLIILTNLV